MNVWAIPPLGTSILILLYGLFVFLKNRKSWIHISFLLMALTTFLWLFCVSMGYLSPEEKIALFWIKILHVGVAFLPATIYHFIVTFLGLKNKIRFVVLSYIVAFAIFLTSLTGYLFTGVSCHFFGYYAKPGPLYAVLIIFVSSMISASLYNLSLGYKRAASGSIMKTRIRYMFWSILTGFFGTVDFLPNYGVKIYPFGFIFVLAFISISGYAIIRYRLLDIETFIHRTIGYLILSFLIFASWAVGFTVLHQMLGRFINIPSTYLTGGMAIIFLWVFVAIKDRIWGFIDRMFYREKYKYREALSAFTKQLNALLDLDQLLPMIVSTIADTMHIDKVSIMLLDEERGEYTVRSQHGLENPLVALGRDDSFATWLFSQRRLVEKEQLAMDPWYSKMLDVGMRKFEELEAEICIPLISRNQMIGILTLGKKISGESYKKEDITLLSDLTAQSTIAISNALTYTLLKKRTEHLHLLSKLGQEMGQTLDLGTVANSLISHIKEVIHAEIVCILLRDEQTGEFVIRACSGLDENIVKETHVRTGEKISGWVAQLGQGILVHDLEQDARFSRRTQERYYTKSLLSVPLIVKGRVIGIVNVNNNRTTKAFTSYDLEVLTGICSEASPIIENARLYTTLRQSYLKTIQSLAEALEAKDRYTRGHCTRVCDYAVRIAKELKLSQSDIDAIATASMLHDIGKIGISEAILLKPAKLTAEEYNEIKRHPETSEKIIRPIGLPEKVLMIIRYHHEWFNGSGYPRGLSRESIPLGARILAVADAYDAMTSDRPYRNALTKEEAIEEIKRCTPNQFDPNIVEAFLKILAEE